MCIRDRENTVTIWCITHWHTISFYHNAPSCSRCSHFESLYTRLVCACLKRSKIVLPSQRGVCPKLLATLIARCLHHQNISLLMCFICLNEKRKVTDLVNRVTIPKQWLFYALATVTGTVSEQACIVYKICCLSNNFNLFWFHRTHYFIM